MLSVVHGIKAPEKFAERERKKLRDDPLEATRDLRRQLTAQRADQ